MFHVRPSTNQFLGFVALASLTVFANGCRKTACNEGEQILDGKCVQLCDDVSDCDDETRFSCIESVCTQCTAPASGSVVGESNCVAYAETAEILDGETNLLSDFDPSVLDYEVSSSIFSTALTFEITTQPGASAVANFNGSSLELNKEFLTIGGQDFARFSDDMTLANVFQQRTLVFSTDVTSWMGRDYSVDITRGREQFLDNPIFKVSSATSPYFGSKLATGNSLLIVGHPNSDYVPSSGSSVGEAGSVHTYHKDGDTWVKDDETRFEQIPGSGHHFGEAIGFEDGILAVSSSDGIYIYERSSTGWIFRHSASVPTPNTTYVTDRLAFHNSRIAIRGAADSEDAKIYIYTLQNCPGISCSLSAPIMVNKPAGVSSAFGLGGVAWANNGWLFVSAAGEECGASLAQCGTVFAFSSANNWQTFTEIAPTTSTSNRENDQFGQNIAACGDIFLAAAPFDDSGDANDANDGTKIDSGAVFVYRRNGNSWNFEKYLKPSTITEDSAFGSQMACDESYMTIATNSGDANVSEKVFVFSYDSDSITQEFSFQSRSSEKYDDGFAHAISDIVIYNGVIAASNNSLDYDRDGNGLMLPEDNSGGVFIYE